MPLLLSPEQELIQKVVREFAETELSPAATAVDRSSRFPRDHIAKMAPLGLLGMTLPAEAGGAGTDTLSYVVALEEVARASGTDAAIILLQNTTTLVLSRGGSEGHRRDLLAPTLAGQLVGATALVEESGGSGLTDLLTTATPNGDGYLLRGSKAFVAMASVADYYVILAQAPEGPTLFTVSKDAKGLHFSEAESKLGLRGLPLAEMYLNRVQLGSDAVVGTPGAAFDVLGEALVLARLGVSAALVGLTQAAWEQSVDFAKNRVQFNQPIVKFGAIRGFLADVESELQAARATTYGAAALRDGGKPFEKETYEARLLSHRIAIKGTRTAQKIHGGAGFMRDLPLERISRDVRTLMHLGGGHDVTRSRLADQLLG